MIAKQGNSTLNSVCRIDSVFWLVFAGWLLAWMGGGIGNLQAQYQPADREPLAPLKAQALREKGPHVILLMVKGFHADAVPGGVESLKSFDAAGCWFTKVILPIDAENALRTSLLTGTLPWDNGVTDNTQDWRQALLLEEKPSLPELFRQAGYYTVGAGHVYHQWIEKRDGKDLKRGFDQARAWDERYDAHANDRESLNQVTKFLRKKQSIPFFLVMGLNSPATLDVAVKLLRDALSRNKLDQETVIAVIGLPPAVGTEPVNLESTLWLRVPEVTPARTKYENPVSALDFLPTLVEAVGEIKLPEGLKGKSLVPLIRDETMRREEAIVSLRGNSKLNEVTVLKGEWKYLKTKDGSEKLEKIAKTDSKEHAAEGSETRQGENESKVVLATVSETKVDEDRAKIQQELAALVPQVWAAYSRPISKVSFDAAPDGSTVYWLQGGDDFPADSIPDLTGRGIDLELEIDFNEVSDANAVMISCGDEKLGFAVYFQDCQPAISINYDGLRTTLSADQKVSSGRVLVKALFGVDGSLDIAAGEAQAHGYAPIEGGFPRQLQGPLKVGRGGKVYGKGTAFGRNFHKVAFCVLPGAQEEQRAAKATPVE